MLMTATYCHVCGHQLEQPVYVSECAVSLTSLCELRPGRTRVYFCEHCGHLQTDQLASLRNYYDEDYKILLDSEEEDQLYRIVDGQIIYRNDHQIRTLLGKSELAPGARVLDYGCAKGAALRRLLELRPDVAGCLYDISSMYRPFWERFRRPGDWAIAALPASWEASFDLVMSYFVFEHVIDLRSTLSEVRWLLKPDGVFHFIVPNVYANPCDFVVSDHVHHFSRQSLEDCLRRHGLSPLEIDETAHESAFVVRACPAGKSEESVQPGPDTTQPLAQRVAEMARLWEHAAHGIRSFEQRQQAASAPAAIYGSGFYGSFIASCLERLDRVECFLDMNPFRQGKQLFGKPVIPPDKLDPSCSAVYVGLNPRIARSSIAKVTGWESRRHEYFFLDSVEAAC